MRRIIFIENRSAVTSAHFSWNCRSEFLSIEPRQGKLEPRERMLIKVEYCQSTSSPPSFHSIETHCDIVSVTDLTKYLKALAKWEKEKKRQEEEFTIDDSKHPPNQITLIEGDRPMSPYRALPPLSPKKKRTRDITWVKPIQPKPDQLQLTVNARSLTRVEFLEKYPEEFNYYFMKGSSNEESESKIECTGEETRMMKTVMANILRTLLDDKYIQQLLLEQQNEKPYYFAQMQGARWPPKADSERGNRLIESIMAMSDDQNSCPPTPVNSLEETSVRSDTQNEDLKLMEEVMSSILKNVISSASSGDTIITAKPLNIK